jgi:hypothetical protein
MLNKCFPKRFFFSKIKNTFKRKQEELKVEEEDEAEGDIGFLQFTKYLQERTEYKWRDYEAQIEADINKKKQSLLQKLSQKNIDEEQIYLDKANRFISCLKDDELDKTKFKDYEIENISKLTNLSRIEIEQIMNEYLYYRGLHSFFAELKSKGEPIPKTQIELQSLIIKRRPEFLSEMQRNMYQSIRKMLGYSNDYIKKQEERRQRENSKSRLFTYKI